MKTTTIAPVVDSTILAELQAELAKHSRDSPEWRAAAAQGLEVASIVAALDAEREIIAGALLQPLLGRSLLDEAATGTIFGEQVARFASQLNELGEFQAGAQWTPDRALSASQADALRRMLLAVVTDPRLVLVRLAEQLRRMRGARAHDEAARLRVAWETREIYAPLANRLGIWQLKWELEDLAFRYLEPTDYRRIAGELNETRVDREKFIETVRVEIISELERIGVASEVIGRPKHIYSIWRKMRRKGLAFDQVFDIRAVRVIVGTVADCYAALGAVHGRWHYIPGEFDDYIATPKDNLYRSLHTA
ncbi:MAG: HD domain-containing protein, partial [Steroidobacteraceae bacterium]